MIGPWTTATETAALVRQGSITAVAATEAALGRIADGDGRLNAFTAVTAERALAEAAAIDAARASGADLPPLAGAPYAVKNLFDLTGLTTVAGSKIERDRPAADGRRVPRRADAGGWRHLRRRPQHGRICLRLHDRERA